MSDIEPLKITLEDLEAEVKDESATHTPERTRSKLTESAGQVGQKLAGVVKDSTAKVTQKIADSAAEATTRSTEAVRDRVTETIQAQGKATADAIEQRLRDVDWKGEAQKGAEGSLRWLSGRLEQLAERMKADSSTSETVDKPKE